jgi:hypothetical protein
MRKLEPAIRTLRLLQVIAEGDGLVQAAGKIGPSQSAGGCEDHIYRLFAEARVPLSNHLLVRQMDTLQAMVGEGLGVSLVPSLTLIRKPKEIRAIRLVPRRYRTIGVLLPPDAVPAPALTRWLDLVRAKAPAILRQSLRSIDLAPGSQEH